MKTLRLGMLVALLALAAAPLFGGETPWLGVKLKVVESKEAKKLGISGGLKVTRVDKNSPAEEAGIEVGDIVLSAGEAAVTTIEAMADALAELSPGDQISLGLRRANGRNEPLFVTLGSIKDKGAKFGDDEEVKQLRKAMRDLDEERRRVRDRLDKRLKELAETNPPERPEPKDPKPEVKKPERVKLTVRLGARFISLTPEEAKSVGVEGGIRVTRVTEGQAAEEGGLKLNDVVVDANGKSVTGTGDLRTLLAGFKPGDALKLTVLRDKKRVELTIVLRKK